MRGYAAMAFVSLALVANSASSEELVPHALARNTFNTALDSASMEIEGCKQQSTIVSMYKAAVQKGKEDQFIDALGPKSEVAVYLLSEKAKGNSEGDPYQYLSDCVSEIQKQLALRKMK
ncbi:hypothetical protein [Pseudomonas canadensis]|uniref:hypothetical protein n=1 Tax=Pseudomonas canadensis TaxID=915099 RepID=UPI00048ACE25|nr:hypothetical protein [Pseudomonas canadensis]